MGPKNKSEANRPRRSSRAARLRAEPVPGLDGAAFETALSCARDGACVVTADGRIVRWNRAAEEILGFAPGEVAGRACREVFGRDESGNRRCYHCEVLPLVGAGEPIRHFGMETEHKTGRRVSLDVSVIALPANGQDGAPLIVHLFRDVTAMRELVKLIHERLAGPATGEASGLGMLTRREIEVLRLIATGLTTKAIAERLSVSGATVRNHVQNILGKLGAHNRLEAVARARRQRLL